MDPLFRKIVRDRRQVAVRYDADTEAVWVYGNPEDGLFFNMIMFQDFHDVQKDIIEYFKANDMKPKIPIRYLVYASQVPKIYSLGGNLAVMVENIAQGNEEQLRECARLATKAMYLNKMNLHLPIQTITLVEGDALGGGFEASLSYGALIVEKQAMLGLQQMRLNIYPGTGIYSFLARAVGMKNADEILTSSRLYSAQEIFDMGGITELAEEGHGEEVVNNYMKRYTRSFEAMQALHAAKFRYAPFDFSELEDMAEIWIDALMRLDTSTITTLQRVAKSQYKKFQNISYRLRTKQDRRFMQAESFPFVDSEGNVIERDRRVNPDPRTKNRES
jgi:DSF synthase